MSHRKPQVVIDLDEYNELLKAKAKGVEGVAPYREALGLIVKMLPANSGFAQERISEELRRKKLKLVGDRNPANDSLTISVERIP